MIARPDHEAQVVRALGSIGVATLASRVLGFVRDVVVARAFGAGPVTDAFFVAFRIPNILRRLLGEGALSTAMIPVFSEYTVTRPQRELLRMLRAVLALALLALTLTTLLGILAAPWILRVIAPGFASDPAQAALATLLTRAMFPYLVLVGLAALATGVLNAPGRGAGDRVHQHAARLAPAPGLDLVPLLRRPRDGIPARGVRDRPGLGVAAGDGALGRGGGDAGGRRDADLLTAPGALHLDAGHGRPRRAPRADRARPLRARAFRVRRHRAHR